MLQVNRDAIVNTSDSFERSDRLSGTGEASTTNARSLRVSYKRVAEIAKNLGGRDNRVRVS
jgi:hypothetical protein